MLEGPYLFAGQIENVRVVAVPLVSSGTTFNDPSRSANPLNKLNELPMAETDCQLSMACLRRLQHSHPWRVRQETYYDFSKWRPI